MEANAGLVAASHKRNELVRIRNDSTESAPKPLKNLNGQICQICGDTVGLTADGDLFVACNECAFPVCRPCYEYERKDGNQSCPQCKTRYKRHKDMLKIPHNQVAGHRAVAGKLGPLVDDSGRFYKPLQGDERGANEVAFYTSFSSDSTIPDHIRKFFPTFYGTKLVTPSDGSSLQPHLVLEDLTVHRVNPSIIDIKIGSRTWAPQSSENYIEKCLKKDRQSSSVSVGFRLSGLQFYVNKEVGLWKLDGKYVQKLSTDKIKLVLKNFVCSNTFKDLETKQEPDCAFVSNVFGGPNGILSQLLQLKAWFEDQTMYHFYACSILVSYEKELAIEGKDPKAEIKMIDFAHVVEGGGVIDHNFLGGLCSLMKFISEILTVADHHLEPSLTDV